MELAARTNWDGMGGGVGGVQRSANPQTPGSENKRIKSCVLLPAAGIRTQLFHLIFSEPGVYGFADPCTYHPVEANNMNTLLVNV